MELSSRIVEKVFILSRGEKVKRVLVPSKGKKYEIALLYSCALA